MNILSIGNSFSTDAHALLPQILAADGEQVLLCNLFIGGCTLERHWNNWRKEEEAYAYEVYLPGSMTYDRPEGVALHEAVEDEAWDVITLQQGSAMSGVRESYTPYLAELAAYCRMVQPQARLLLHQTWAYAANCTAPAFATYHNDQEEMYRLLTEAYAEAAIEAELTEIIPTGRAFQTARQTAIGDNLNSDGMHANIAGRYLGAACFYEKIYGRSILGHPFCPAGLDPALLPALQLSAHLACEASILRK